MSSVAEYQNAPVMPRERVSIPNRGPVETGPGPRGIEQQINRQLAELDQLERALANLADRLERVMEQRPTGDSAPCQGGSGHCPLGDVLANHNMRLEIQTARVVSMLDRLQI